MFTRRRFFEDGAGVAFYPPDGTELADSALDADGVFAVAMFLDGHAIPYPDAHGNPVTDTSSFLLVLNGNWQPTQFALPQEPGPAWDVELATETPNGSAPAGQLPLLRPGRSLLVLSGPLAG